MKRVVMHGKERKKERKQLGRSKGSAKSGIRGLQTRACSISLIEGKGKQKSCIADVA
jgi:hypothetical protein